jgi:hypothetical protein
MNEYKYKKNKWDELVKNNDTIMDELELQEVYYKQLREDYKNGILKEKPILFNYGDLAKYIMEEFSAIEINYAENLPENIKTILEKRRLWLNNPSDDTFYDANNRTVDAIKKFKRQREYFDLCKPLFVEKMIVEQIWIKLNKISIQKTTQFVNDLFILLEMCYLKSKEHPLVNDKELQNYEKIENKLKLLEKVLNEAEENESLLFYSYHKDYKKLLNSINEFRQVLSKPLMLLTYDSNTLINDKGSKNKNGKAIFFAQKVRILLKKYYNKKLNKINSLVVDSIFNVYYSENEITKFCNKK